MNSFELTKNVAAFEPPSAIDLLLPDSYFGYPGSHSCFFASSGSPLYPLLSAPVAQQTLFQVSRSERLSSAFSPDCIDRILSKTGCNRTPALPSTAGNACQTNISSFHSIRLTIPCNILRVAWEKTEEFVRRLLPEMAKRGLIDPMELQG